MSEKEISKEKEIDKRKQKDETSLENRCPACKASISFNAKLGKWKCEYCGSEFTLEEMQKHSDNASTEKKHKREVAPDSYNDYISYHCESCGAEIIASEETASTFCVYCGNTAILQSKLSGKFCPDQMIPFKKEKKEAEDAFKSLSKGRPLVPKDFTDIKNIEKIKGVYIPFWLYDLKVSGDILMNATIVRSWTSGDTHYTKTDTFHVTRGGNMSFDNIPVDASTHFDNAIMNSIEPFNYKELIPYNHAYLSGFYAEKYDEDAEQTYPEAEQRAINTAQDILKDDARLYTTKVITSNQLESKQIDKIYALLPVWMVNVKYKDKMYIFAMNGQTGEFIGNIPLDKMKTFIYTIVIFALTFGLSILISLLIYLGGK